MLNEELGAKVLSAAKASKALALDYAATGKWMPRERLPKLGTYQGGWPSFSPPTIGSDDGPRKLDDLFGLERDSLIPFAYNDVPELVELLNYVQDHPDIGAAGRIRREPVRFDKTRVGGNRLQIFEDRIEPFDMAHL